MVTNLPSLPPIEPPFDLQLEPDEQIVWMGQPDPRRRWRVGIPIVALGIPITALGIFLEATVRTLHSAESAPALAICGLVFILCGLVLMATPYFCWKSAESTLYAVTNRRVFCKENGKITIKTPQDIGTIRRQDYSDGRSDLLFFNRTYSRNTFISTDGFFAIEDACKAEQLLIEMTMERHKKLLEQLDS